MADDPTLSPWTHPRTRRAILAGTAAAAALGTTAAVIGASQMGGGSPASQDRASGPTATPTPDPDALLDRPIAEPKRRAAHLLRRAGFGGTLAEIDEFAALSRDEAADRLLNFAAVDNSALNARLEAADFELKNPPKVYGDIQLWWIARLAYSARPLEERMTLIWHGLLTSEQPKVGYQLSYLMVGQNELFRSMALPKYDDLLKAVSKDPAMLIYLDNVVSTKAHPNENYARELMELFSLGVGNYTETDIRESARAFTGWRVNLPRFNSLGVPDYSGYTPGAFVNPAQHDTGTKTFMGKTGNFTGDDIVDIIMQQPAAGRFITTRLFTEFANFNPKKETIDRLVKVWDGSGHQIRDVVRAILTSDEFYSERSYRAIVRSPVELLVGAIRGLGIQSESTPALTAAYPKMDQSLFNPPSVAGWPGGSLWLSSTTWYARLNFLDALLFPRGRPLPVPALASAATPEAMVNTALSALVDSNVSAQARDALYQYAKGIARPDERAASIAYLVLASPEYQLV